MLVVIQTKVMKNSRAMLGERCALGSAIRIASNNRDTTTPERVRRAPGESCGKKDGNENFTPAVAAGKRGWPIRPALRAAPGPGDRKRSPADILPAPTGC